MGFEEEREPRWHGDDGRGRKRALLRAAIDCGAVLTGFVDGEEIPYDGARFHAEELQAEGFFKRCEVQPVEDATIWIAVTPGLRT